MPYSLQPDSVKTVSTLGSVKVGSGLLIDQYGVLSSNIKPGTGITLDPDGTLNATGGAGDSTASGISISKSFTQVTHGFTVGQPLTRIGGVWVLANAAMDATAEVSGIVSVITDADTFVLTFIGYMNGLTGLVDGTTYYLSDVTAGAYTDTSPSAVDTVSKPIFIAVSATEALVVQSRGILN